MDECSAPSVGLKRRQFFGRIGQVAAATNLLGLSNLLQAAPAESNDGSAQRRNRAFQTRVQAALEQMQQGSPTQSNNGDETNYPDRIASYTKGLPHDELGRVDPNAYNAFLGALASGEPEDFDAIPMGCPDLSLRRKLVNPQAGLAFDLEGCDSHALAIPPAPAFNSAWEAGEIVENYWMAITRDVPFDEFSSNAFALSAAAELSALTDFRGPKTAGGVTPQMLFRGSLPGCTTGPYMSQFLWLPAPFGANYIEQRIRTRAPNVDHMTQYQDWLAVQRGFKPTGSEPFDATRRYIRSGRDLSQWVHIDVLYQAYFHALLILLTPPSSDANSAGIGAPFDAGNPYLTSPTQDGFGTFGGPHIATILAEMATRALKAVWFQKWFVHRRLRPEAFAGRIHNHLIGAARYPIHRDALNSTAAAYIHSQHGTYLLPMAFPEGSPLHPAYGAGHATVAGACVTILKAWFDENYVIPNPVQATSDGLSLRPYSGEPLTVGGELNKLAANVAIGRNIAGVHWRSDATESLKLGEAVAISVLRDHRACFNEDFGGFTLTKFDGTTVKV